jgi:hypothetical protein
MRSPVIRPCVGRWHASSAPLSERVKDFAKLVYAGRGRHALGSAGQQGSEFFAPECRGAGKSGRPRFPHDLRCSPHVIIMPVGYHDEFYSVESDTETGEIRFRHRHSRLPVDTGVHNHPLAEAKVYDDAFANTGAEN